MHESNPLKMRAPQCSNPLRWVAALCAGSRHMLSCMHVQVGVGVSHATRLLWSSSNIANCTDNSLYLRNTRLISCSSSLANNKLILRPGLRVCLRQLSARSSAFSNGCFCVAPPVACCLQDTVPATAGTRGRICRVPGVSSHLPRCNAPLTPGQPAGTE